MIFQDKIKMNRKKNLSSKIIVDQYDNLIKNSKIQPNFETLFDPPLSPHFTPKDAKYIPSRDQSSESEYSMHNQRQAQLQKQCHKCNEIFSLRVYESHLRICEEKQTNYQKQQEKFNFNKKDQYSLFAMNPNIEHQSKMLSARSKQQQKCHQVPQQNKKIELKKSLSKMSIHSQQKKPLNRPSSSTRNKPELKDHENLKQKILSKLQGTRNKNRAANEQATKRVSSSHNKHPSSNSKPKSTTKNIHAYQNSNKKYSGMNSSSINKKKMPNQSINYEFNRSEIMSHLKDEERKRQKGEFVSKTKIKEEKKQTLKKKNINYNNSFVQNQLFQREKQKSRHMENFNFTENESYFSRAGKYEGRKNNIEKQFLREQLRKEGPFRRESSTSNSKGKFKREYQIMEEKPYRGVQEVKDEYYFFENHPSSVPSHVTRREEEPFRRFEQIENEEIYEENSSNIIRNKLGLNKNLLRNKETAVNSRQPQPKLKTLTQHFIAQNKRNHQQQVRNPQMQKQSFHRRTNSSREKNTQERENVTELKPRFVNGQINRNPKRQQVRNPRREQVRNSRREQVRNPTREQITNPRRVQDRNQRNQHLFRERRENQQRRNRPENPMGNQRLIGQRRQNQNRPNQRPQPRMANQRLNSQNQQRQNSQNQRLTNQNRNPRENQPRPQQRNRRQNQQQNRRQTQPEGTNQRSNSSRRQQGQRGNQRIRQDTLNFISNTLNEQFQVMNQHFNLLNNIFSNFSNIVNVNITASTDSQNPTSFVFRSHGNRRRNRNNQGNQQQSDSHSEYSDFSSDFSSEDSSAQNQTDYSEDQYYFQEEEEENPGMTEHQINSIPILRYSKQHQGSNQCTICLVELNQNERFKKLYCHHVFHTECIDEWLKRKNACPVCRDQMGVQH